VTRSAAITAAGVPLLAVALALGCAGVAAQPAEPPQIGQVSRDSVWVPTPERMIRRLLQMADTTSEDVVVDLGSGDGRIPIYAARHFGARGIGVELEENLVRISVEAAKAQGVADRTRFFQQDLFEFDLSVATVVALYISPGVMTRLKPRLLALKPGTRVVSHFFTLDDWEPDETIRVEDRTGYLWVVPADVRGAWTVRTGDDLLRLSVQQERQRLAIRGARDGREVPVIGVRLRGTEISFTSFDPDGSVRHYRGRIDGARMGGESGAQGDTPVRWSAQRD
jgi:SAM-dependent methyltransferase